MNPANLRKVLRGVHLVSAGAVGFLVYAPSETTDGGFDLIVAVAFFPILVLTGLGMWFGPRLLRRRRPASREG